VSSVVEVERQLFFVPSEQLAQEQELPTEQAQQEQQQCLLL
jgi:hypothetical protein